MLIGIFYSQIVESSSLVSVLFREAISHPYISFFHLLVNGFSVIYIWTPRSITLPRSRCACGVTSKRMLTKFVSISSYSPKVRTFGTVITSTKVFSHIIICKVFDKTILYVEILDYVLRDLMILYLDIVDSIHSWLTILAITRVAIRISYAALSLNAYRGIL